MRRRRLCPSGEGGAAENPGAVRSGRPRGRLAGAVRSAACRRPSLASPRDPLRADIPSARPPVFSATSHQHGLLRRPCVVFSCGARVSAPRAGAARRVRGVALRCGRGRGPLRAGPAAPCVAASCRPTPAPRRIPQRFGIAVLPARPRPLRLVACPVWAAADGSGRRVVACSRRGGAPTGPPRRDGGRRRRGPRASGAATAGRCEAGCGASARRAGQRRRGNEPPDGPHRAASAPAARSRPQAEAALPRGPSRSRPTARLRSRSGAEPSRAGLRSKTARGETVPECGEEASVRRVRDGIAMTTRPTRGSTREAEEARETARTHRVGATPHSGTASREPTPPSAAGASAHEFPIPDAVPPRRPAGSPGR